MTGYGLGAPRSMTLATKRFETACQLGDAMGCFSAAWACDAGDGVQANPTRAAELYDTACAGEVKAACEFLAD